MVKTIHQSEHGKDFPGEIGHLAADNDGKPELVADQLRRFFGPDEGLAT